MNKSIDRIKEMENALNNSIKAIKEFEKALEKFVKAQDEINKVSTYYGSETWFSDVEENDSGIIPQNVKVGILSEDIAYDMLMENRELAIRMIEEGTKMAKK